MLLRTVVLRTVAFAAVAAVVALGHVLGGNQAARTSALPVEHAVEVPPVWTLADAASNPGCVAVSEWESGRPAPVLVVQRVRDAVHRRIAFDRAWRINHNDTEADDLWVLGVCPSAGP